MPNQYSLKTVQDAYPEYNVSEYVESGGFKDVFRGEFEDTEIVVKLFSIEGRTHLRRAEREALAMQQVDSDILVNLIESFEDNLEGQRTYVFTEEYVPGGPLRDLIPENTGFSLGVNVLSSLLELLVEFDAKNLIHRDIKPSNIMISPEGEVTVLDVGIVRFEDMTSLTPDHVSRGPSTPPYAAPELLENQKQDQDIRTDIFSCGIVFYECITGEHPFRGGGASVTDSIVKGENDELGDVTGNSELDERLNRLYEKMTQTRQHERPRKPRFAIEELEEIQELILDV